MKKLIMLLLAFIKIFSLTACTYDNEEQEYVDSFCELDVSDVTLYISSSMYQLINIYVQPEVYSIEYSYLQIFRQNQMLYDFLSNDNYRNNFKLNVDQLFLDYLSSNGPELDSYITLDYSHEDYNCSKDINVVYYDYDSYFSDFDPPYDITIKNQGENYIYITFPDGDKTRYYYINLENQEEITLGDIIVRITDKTYGYIIDVVEDDTLVYQTFLGNYGYLYGDYFYEPFYTENEDVISIYHRINFQQSVRVNMAKDSSNELYIYFYSRILDPTIITTTLELHQPMTYDENQYVSITYELVDYNIVELTLEMEQEIYTYRILLFENQA